MLQFKNTPEILFHIYTGRLLQNYSQGLGPFIDHTGDSISFKEQSNSDIDALFFMSSGCASGIPAFNCSAQLKEHLTYEVKLLENVFISNN